MLNAASRSDMCIWTLLNDLDANVIPIQMTVDCDVEIGEMCAEHTALCQEYSPVLGEVNAVRALESSDNIPIESSWQYAYAHFHWTRRQRSQYAWQKQWLFHSSYPAALISSTGPNILQYCLDKWLIYWNRGQPGKVLPSATTPNTIWKLPGKRSREERMHSVSDDFEACAVDAFTRIGSLQVELIHGWGTFTAMLGGLTGE
ncbi:hypothetical protein C8J56DRAFT_1050900 [Mycena floridula]|nr:hypothetical protein C8J56DRAFT_1050900 [Mycena floridula]